MTKPGISQASSQKVLTDAELRLIDAWWRACNYLSVGMIYLRDNPLLREPLQPHHADIDDELSERQLARYTGQSIIKSPMSR